MKNIAIFASGSGSNAEQLIKYFTHHQSISVAVVITNKANAGVIARAERLQVPHIVINDQQANDGQYLLSLLKQHQIDLVVLAGYLKLFPADVIQQFPDRVINLHPSLLPKYGGKGMYGSKVHEAVLANNEIESGITIHFVNEEYDKGAIIHQSEVLISTDETVESLATKIHHLEHENLAKVVEEVLLHL